MGGAILVIIALSMQYSLRMTEGACTFDGTSSFVDFIYRAYVETLRVCSVSVRNAIGVGPASLVSNSYCVVKIRVHALHGWERAVFSLCDQGRVVSLMSNGFCLSVFSLLPV